MSLTVKARESPLPVKRNYTQILQKMTTGDGRQVNFYYAIMNIKSDFNYKADSPWDNSPEKENNIIMMLDKLSRQTEEKIVKLTKGFQEYRISF